MTVSFRGLWEDSLDCAILNSCCYLDSCNAQLSWHYYTQSDTALKLFGYESPSNFILPKPAGLDALMWRGKSFQSRDELLWRAAPSFLSRIPTRDGFYSEDPMVCILEYPISVGASWTYRDSGKPWRMDRQVMLEKELSVEAGKFPVFQVEMLYDRDNDGHWDDDIHIIDHFASEGLIRREILIDSIHVISPQGIRTGGLFRVLDVYELARYELNE